MNYHDGDHIPAESMLSKMSQSEVPLADIIELLDSWYPPSLAESWDNVGLVVGKRSDRISKILCCVDLTTKVVEHAIDQHYDVIIAHHPLLFKPLNTCNSDTPKGALISTLLVHNIAVFTAHTNADAACEGTSDIIIKSFGVVEKKPISPYDSREHYDQWHVYIPNDHVDQVLTSIFSAGAGTIGQYSQCAWRSEGCGQFMASPDASPFVGSINKIHYEPETKVEFVAHRCVREAVYDALIDTHPYQNPAYGLVELVNPVPVSTGIGRYARLIQPRTVGQIVQELAVLLPKTYGGIRVSGDLHQIVRTVGVCTGSGDSLLSRVAALGLDLYITADLRHHPVDEYHRVGGKAVIDAGHWATEYPWTVNVAQKLQDHFPNLVIAAYTQSTEPWTEIVVP